MKSRTRSRKAASIGSHQSLKSDTASSTSGCTASHFVVGLVMAWSPARRANTGFDWVGQSGDYATRNSNQPRDSTNQSNECVTALVRLLRVTLLFDDAPHPAEERT